LWPWILIAFVVWAPGGWILGLFFNQVMVEASTPLFILFDLALPLLTIFTALAKDAENHTFALGS
jgi:hypothetical protein